MESIKRIINKLYSRKSIITTIRLDVPTTILVDELSTAFNLTRSEVLRISLWLTAILMDPNTTLRQILSKEAIEKLTRGEDTPVVDAIKQIGSLLENKAKKYYKKELHTM